MLGCPRITSSGVGNRFPGRAIEVSLGHTCPYSHHPSANHVTGSRTGLRTLSAGSSTRYRRIAFTYVPGWCLVSTFHHRPRGRQLSSPIGGITLVQVLHRGLNPLGRHPRRFVGSCVRVRSARVFPGSQYMCCKAHEKPPSWLETGSLAHDWEWCWAGMSARLEYPIKWTMFIIRPLRAMKVRGRSPDLCLPEPYVRFSRIRLSIESALPGRSY